MSTSSAKAESAGAAVQFSSLLSSEPVSPIVPTVNDWTESFTTADGREARVVVRAPRSQEKPILPVAPIKPGENAYAYLSNAIEQARLAGAGKVVIPKDRYILSIPSVDGKQPPDCSTAHLRFTDLDDLEIDGQGSEFVFTEFQTGITIAQCHRLLIKNVRIDWSLPLAALGVVKNASEPYSKFVSIDPAWSEDFNLDKIMGVAEYDGKRRTWKRSQSSAALGLTADQYSRVDALTFQSRRFNGFPTGAEVIVQNWRYGANAFAIVNGSEDVSFENIQVYSAPGMAFWFGAGAVRGFRIVDCKVLTNPLDKNRVASTNSDACHFHDVRGDIIMEGNDFSGQGDDSLNVESTFFQVMAIDGSDLVIKSRSKFDEQLNTNGDLCAVFGPDLSFIDAAKIVGTRSEDGCFICTMEHALANIPPGSFFANFRLATQRFVIRNNSFHDNLGRGIVVKGANGLIENNQIDSTCYGGICLATDRYFAEGYGAINIILRNNRIKSTNYAYWSRPMSNPFGGAVNLIADTEMGLSHFPLFQDVSFENNVIFDTPGPGVIVSSAKRIRLQNNEIIDANHGKHSGNADVSPSANQFSIMVSHSEDVTVNANQLRGSSKEIDCSASAPAAERAPSW